MYAECLYANTMRYASVIPASEFIYFKSIVWTGHAWLLRQISACCASCVLEVRRFKHLKKETDITLQDLVSNNIPVQESEGWNRWSVCSSIDDSDGLAVCRTCRAVIR